jgi:hypothetical protein
LYQAAWTAEGDDMMTSMRSAKFGDKLDRKAYYGFIKILCGIERVEHAVMMKGYGHAPGVKSYSLLIEKLARYNLGDRSGRQLHVVYLWRKESIILTKGMSKHRRRR